MAPVVEVSDAGHCRALLLELNEQRLRGQFCDVTIIAEDTKFRAHKNVLAASSPFFKRALAQEPTCPSPAQVLELPGVQAGVFSDVLNFIYNSRLAVPSPAAARALGAVGRRLGIPSLQGLEAGPAPPPAPRDTNGAWTPPVPAAEPARAARPGPAGEDAAPAAEEAEEAAEASLRCGLCGRGFGSAAALGFHAKLHRGRRGLCCRHCGKSFIHVKRLQTHEVGCRDGGGDGDNNTAGTDGAVSSGAVTATTTTTTNSAAAAPRAAKKALLLRHRALEPGAEQEPLVKVVDGQVLYLCGVCQRSYMTLSSLKRHANVHSWRRKYPCRYCDKVFALAEYRTKHEVWHTGERRYQCIFCWDTFVTYYNLKTHQKAFHGISPGLIASEKTPNGGYRPKLNALKLYRLLPMRANKRPYKTYSQGAVPDGAAPAPAAAPGDAGAAAFPPAAPPRPEPASVIAYGRAAPSVIVRGGGGSGAASVIAYNGRAGEEAPGAAEAPAAAPVTPAVPIKKQVLRDYIEAQRAAAEGAATEGTAAAAAPQNPAGAGRTMTYVAKPAYAGSAAAGEGLCQITVRIGEEAIVKRRISGTDLRGDGAAEERRGDGDDDSDAEDRLWRPYYSYKPKRKAGGTTGTAAAPGAAKKPRWRRKLRSLRRAPGDDGEDGRQRGDAARRRERQHPCRVCGKSFPALRKLRKHQRGHEAPVGTAGTAPGRVGRRPLLRFACPTCAKVCKTAAALSRHAQRHRRRAQGSPGSPGSPPGSPPGSAPGSPGSAQGSAPGSPPGSPPRSPAPPTVIAYTPPAADRGGVPVSPGVTGAVPPAPGDTGGGDTGEGDPMGDRGGDPSGGDPAGDPVGDPGGFPVQDQPLALLCRAPGGDPELGDAPGAGLGVGDGGGTPRGGPRAPPAPPPTPFPLPFGPRLVAAYPFPFPLPLALVLPEPERGFLGAGGGAGGAPLPPPTPSTAPPTFGFPGGGGERPRQAGGGT
ncbi:zinc finger and BTB domain-containing protein 4 [Taeniopygia guttata]|uniref:zinc finger and BTB domain-containing protein 4 n=1 Tax=Taeniopygia guttata TaxID=59729 RepID=UPI003BB8F3E6